MHDVILCPRCERRLQLPANFQAELVRCPSCETTFPFASALPLPSPIQAALPAIPPNETPPTPPRWEEMTDEGRSVRRIASRRSSRSPCLIAALIVGAVMLMLGIGVVGISALAWRMRGRATVPVRAEEDEEERRAQLRQAFRDRQPVEADEIARQVQPLFDEMGAALRAADGDRLMKQFDVDRMLDECMGAGVALPIRTARERRDFRRGMRQGLSQSMVQRSPIFQWDTTEIRKVKKLNNDEAVVIVRHKHPDGTLFKLRWWVTRRNGDWKVYDLEDLDVGGRNSDAMASLLNQGPGRALEVSRAAKTVGDAIQDVATDDLDGAEKKLAEVRGVKLPQRFEALRQLVDGMIHLHRGKFDEALKHLEEAHRLQPDWPLVDLLSGVALNRLGKSDQALKHLQAYRDLLGEDANVCREIGEALRGQQHFAEAAREYRKALDFNPKEAEALLGLLRSIVNDDLKDIGPRFAKLDNLRENFDTLAEDCEDRELPALLDPLVQAMRKLDPEYPPVDYYQALVQARTGHPDEAVVSIKSALRKQTDGQQRQAYQRQFLKAMASGGHYAKAYAAASDARDAFRYLAGEAAKKYQLDELKKLVAAHAAKYGDDALPHLYQGEIHVREGKYDKADRAFTDAVGRRPDAETLKTFRASRVLARFHTGQAMAAYRDIGPREETFAQLASLMFDNKQDAQLKALLDVHAKESPRSVELIRFRTRVLVRQKQATDAIALFKSLVARTRDEEKRSEFVSEFLSDMREAGKLIEGYRAAPDAIGAFRNLASELLDDGEWDDLRRLVAAHREGHAEDPWLALYQGRIHEQDEAWDEAANVFGEALKRDPKDARAGIETSFVLALYKLGQWQRAYAEVRPHDKTFTQLANLMAGDKKGTELEALVRAHRPHAGDNPELLYYEARAKVLTGKYAEAVPLFRQAYEKQTTPYLRPQYQWAFLRDMAQAGRWQEGYRAAVDKSAALDALSSFLLEKKKDRELAALLEEHRKGGGEPWYSYYLGELDLLRGQAREAVGHFAAALAKGQASEQWRLRDGLYRARFRAGEAAAAYEADGPKDTAFASLARMCSENKDARQLQALLAARRKDRPDDPALVSWELELRWLKQDYEDALRLLAEHRDDVFSQPQFRWKAEGYRVRCLVRLKRGDEAVRVAEETVNKHSGDRLLLVLAHAARGDVPQAIAAVGTMGKNAYSVRRCYEDDDLGPILRSEKFRAFREKFPAPKKTPGED